VIFFSCTTLIQNIMDRGKILKIALGLLVVYIIFRVFFSKRRRQGRRAVPPTWVTQVPVETYEDWAPTSWETIPPNTVTNRPVTTLGPTSQQLLTATPQPLSQSVSLLPKTSPPPAPGATSWAEFAPQSLQGQQLLSPQKYVGVDTQGSTLRNASHDLRRDPPIPRKDVSPFLNSTIDADPWRKPLDDCQ
jgi:hypothetical protein